MHVNNRIMKCCLFEKKKADGIDDKIEGIFNYNDNSNDY